MTSLSYYSTALSVLLTALLLFPTTLTELLTSLTESLSIVIFFVYADIKKGFAQNKKAVVLQRNLAALVKIISLSLRMSTG
jgi:hypothetical protein